jgi:hypothetical protein
MVESGQHLDALERLDHLRARNALNASEYETLLNNVHTRMAAKRGLGYKQWGIDPFKERPAATSPLGGLDPLRPITPTIVD